MLNVNSTILIVGLGLIGGSYCQGLKKNGNTIIGLDLNEESFRFGLDNGLIDEGYSSLNEDICKKVDLVIICLYPSIELEWINNNQQFFKPNTILMDVSGVKSNIVDSIQKNLREDLRFISTHPMAGRELSGIQNSDSKIFEKANYIIVPTDKNDEDDIESAKYIANVLNFRKISLLDAKTHDELIGFVSQLTHIIAISLMTCNEDENLQNYTGDSFRDLTRIARINENMWTELFLTNKDALLAQIDQFVNQLNSIKNLIKNDDADSLKEIMRKSTKRRALFDK